MIHHWVVEYRDIDPDDGAGDDDEDDRETEWQPVNFRRLETRAVGEAALANYSKQQGPRSIPSRQYRLVHYVSKVTVKATEIILPAASSAPVVAECGDGGGI